jgi:hypothetical protein
MNADYYKFSLKKGSSLSFIDFVISELKLDQVNYINNNVIRNFIDKSANNYWLPDRISRYVETNLHKMTGLKPRWINCCFCGAHVEVFAKQSIIDSGVKGVCSDKCRFYSGIKEKCSDSFFKHIPKLNKESILTSFLYSMQRRQNVINKLNKKSKLVKPLSY